jgi:hypothetical protein
MKKKTLTTLIIAVVILTLSILIANNLQRHNDPLLEAYDLDGKSTKQLVEYLEDKLDEPYGLNASINSDSLIIKDNREQVTIDLDEDLFYLSMAPYFNQTHPCGIHSLITCRGELKNETFKVKITNSATDEVIMNKSMTSYHNGFIGVWLPKDQTFTIEIEKDGSYATATVETSSGSNTCLTTLKLT